MRRALHAVATACLAETGAQAFGVGRPWPLWCLSASLWLFHATHRTRRRA